MAHWALGLWIITAVGGAYLWGTVVSRSRTGVPGARPTRLPQLVLFAHPLLALAGLAVWVAYLYRDATALAWVAFALLLTVATLGDVLFVRTLRSRQEGTAEGLLPMPVVLGHGLLGLTTLLLVLLTALGVGR